MVLNSSKLELACEPHAGTIPHTTSKTMSMHPSMFVLKISVPWHSSVFVDATDNMTRHFM